MIEKPRPVARIGPAIDLAPVRPRLITTWDALPSVETVLAEVRDTHPLPAARTASLRAERLVIAFLTGVTLVGGYAFAHDAVRWWLRLWGVLP